MTSLRLIATAAVCLTAGSVIGYKYAEKKLLAEFEERLVRETNVLRRMYKPDYETAQAMVEELHGKAVKAMQEYQNGTDESLMVPPQEPKEPVAYHKIKPSTVEIAKKEEKVVERSVFEPSDDRGEIYVISAQENAEGSYEDVTGWTYYAGDGVVTDIHEDRIEDFEKYIGTDFVNHFGDDNTLYIRNEVLLIDYEIVRSHGSYRQEVLGEEEPPPPRPSQRFSPGS